MRVTSPPFAQRPILERCALALALYGVALAFRLAMAPLEGGLAFVTFYPATVVAFFLLGSGPGFLVTLLSAATAYYVFIAPSMSWSYNRPGLFGVGVFLLSSAFVAVVTGRYHASIREREAARRALADNEALLSRVGEAAGIGGWDIDLRDDTVRWSAQTRAIHEVPRDFVPTFDSVLSFYGPAEQALIRGTLAAAAKDRRRWDIELAMTTAKGRAVQVRSVGSVELVDGRSARLVGSLQDVSERHRLEQELAAAAARTEDLYENAPCGYYSVERDGFIAQANSLMLSWLGLPREEIVGKRRITEFLSERGRAVFEAHFPRLADGEEVVGPLEVELQLPDGSTRWVNVAATAIRDATGAFVRSRTMAYDITEARAARIALQELSVEQAAMLDNEIVGIVKLRDRTVIWKNAAMERLFGYSHDELIDQPGRLVYQDDESYERAGEEAYHALSSAGSYRTQMQMRRKDGTLIWIDINGIMVSPERGESMWLMSDITALKEHQAHVEHIAFHDALTGLPNRLLLTDRLAQGIALADRLGQRMLVGYVDLDGFKAVNDRHGHEAGDLLLKEMARRLQGCVRSSDTIARLGGDEYALLLTPVASLVEGGGVVERARATMAVEVDLGEGRTATVTASIGVAIYPDDAASPEELLRMADASMYRSKREHKARADA